MGPSVTPRPPFLLVITLFIKKEFTLTLGGSRTEKPSFEYKDPSVGGKVRSLLPKDENTLFLGVS